MRFVFDPRAKLYFLLIANLLLFFHVNMKTEMILMVLFILPLFLAGKYKSGIIFAVVYGVMAGMEFWLLPTAQGFLQNLVSLLSVGIRIMMPCIVTGAYAFSTTTPSELMCALRKMKVPESIIITCAVVIRFFPTVKEDYTQIRSAMALRGIYVGWRHPMQSLEYVIIPLLMNGSFVAQDLSVAALTKGMSLKGVHTSMTRIRMCWFDWTYMALCTIPLLMFLGGVI